MFITQFKTLGIGYAISNITLDTTKLEVYLPEMSSSGVGTVDPFTYPLEAEMVNEDGVIERLKINTTNSIECEWLPGKSWCFRPPSIRRGERVEVFTIGDTGRFWWRELGLDEYLRRLDTILIAVSNKRFEVDEGDVELDRDNTYFVEFSTQSKQVRMITSKSDGEPFVYDMGFDTREGTFNITDSFKNSFELDSAEKRFKVINNDETEILLEKNFINCSIKDEAWVRLEDGTITATSGVGDEVKLRDNKITATNKSGSRIKVDGNEVELKSSSGGSVKVDSNVVAKSAGGAWIKLQGTEIVIRGTLIRSN